MTDRELLRLHIEAVWGISIPPLDGATVELADNLVSSQGWREWATRYATFALPSGANSPERSLNAWPATATWWPVLAAPPTAALAALAETLEIPLYLPNPSCPPVVRMAQGPTDLRWFTCSTSPQHCRPVCRR